MLNRVTSYILKSKWKFCQPQNKPLLLIDGRFDPLKYYFNKSDYNILYRRGEEINFFVILKCLMQLDFKFKNYILNYIEIVKPKLLITSIHNYVGFYKLSKLTGIKTMFIQSAIVTKWGDLFGNKIVTNSKNKKKFRVDYMLVFNSSYGKEFSKFISGKYFVIGSFKNNLIKKNYKKILGPYPSDSAFTNYKKNSLYISTYHDQALIPYKIINRKGYNLTLGLSYRRLSPAHGTAKDIMFKKKSDNASYLACMLS